jgi:hypothetical protein
MQYTGALQLGKKKPRVFPNPGGVFLGVFPGWVYSRCIFRAYFLVYFTRGISFIFRAVHGRTGAGRTGARTAARARCTAAGSPKRSAASMDCCCPSLVCPPRKRTKSKSKSKTQVRSAGRGLYQSPVFGPKAQSPIPSWTSNSKSKSKSKLIWTSKSKSKRPSHGYSTTTSRQKIARTCTSIARCSASIDNFKNPRFH